MSLAVLARKTKTQQRLRSTKCSTDGGGRSVGFVLNMTGRGGGIGLSGMSYKQRGMNCRKTPANMSYQGKVNTGCQCEGCCSGGGRCKTGQAGTCCAGDGWPQRVSKECRANCGLCWYGGLSQPAPQMSYRNYINRKAKGAYRPGGAVCCNDYCSDKRWTTETDNGAGIDVSPKFVPATQPGYDLAPGPGQPPFLKAFSWREAGGQKLATLGLFPSPGTDGDSGYIELEGGQRLNFLASESIPADPTYPAGQRLYFFKVGLSECTIVQNQNRCPMSSAFFNALMSAATSAINASGSMTSIKMTFHFGNHPHALHHLKSQCKQPPGSHMTWKQSPDILASEITEHRAQATIRCANNIRKRKPQYLGNTLISNKLVAKPVCSWYNPETCQYETVKGPNPLTQNCQCSTTLPIKGRLGYTRINKNWCNTTKTLTVGTSSSEQIAKRKQRAFLCPCGPKQDTCTPECDGEKNIVELTVNYGTTGVYSITGGPTKLCRCDTTFVLTRSPYTFLQQPQFISVINPLQFVDTTGSWDDNTVETFYNNTPLAINLGKAPQVKFKIPAAWCEAGYKKLYFFEVANPPTETGAPSWDICAPNCDNEKKESARYCYPRPFHTGKNCGLSLGLTRLQKEACKQGCPKYWYSGNLRLR